MIGGLSRITISSSGNCYGVPLPLDGRPGKKLASERAGVLWSLKDP